MATVEKLSVSLGKAEATWLRRRARKEGASVSAVLAATIRATREREAQLAKQQAALASYVEWATDGEGLTEAELDAAAQELAAVSRK